MLDYILLHQLSNIILLTKTAISSEISTRNLGQSEKRGTHFKKSDFPQTNCHSLTPLHQKVYYLNVHSLYFGQHKMDQKIKLRIYRAKLNGIRGQSV